MAESNLLCKECSTITPEDRNQNVTYFISQEETTPYDTETLGKEETVLPLEIRILMTSINSAGILANGFVLFIILKSTKMRHSVTNIFITNQSVTDLATAIFSILIHINYKTTDSVFSSFLCRFIMSEWPMWALMMVSTFNLVAITTERYLMIIHPIVHKCHFTKKKALSVVVGMLICGFVCSSFLIATTKLVDGKCHELAFWVWPEIEPVIFMFNLMLLYFIPLVIMVIVYIRILNVVRIRNKVSQNSASSQESTQPGAREKAKLKHEFNILVTAITICTCFFICYTPLILKVILYNIGVVGSLKTTNYIDEIPVVLLYSNCSINPIIYIFKYDLFQKEAKRILNMNCFVSNQTNISAIV